MVQRIDTLGSIPQQATGSPEQQKTSQKYNQHWNGSSIAPADDTYDLDFSAAVNKNQKQQGPQVPNSNSCTCNNTCSGCVSTDSGCRPTQDGCYVSQQYCGHTDKC